MRYGGDLGGVDLGGDDPGGMILEEYDPGGDDVNIILQEYDCAADADADIFLFKGW